MPKEVFILSHAVFGTIGALAAVWVFVEALNIHQENVTRIKYMSLVVALSVWLSYLVGGYFYVKFYGVTDKTIILAGPWPWAHKFAMEVKEHVFFILLVLATYLPIAVRDPHLLGEKGNKSLVLTVSGLVMLLVMAMDGYGALIIMGAKQGLLAR
ncbi:MAG: hypothetical protein C4567_00595 [Deltaproteobacteria bacterium]|nr:MAG: hypothetical protein C4567_00595 [Deltaproteobacteria bacterium]